MDLSTVCLRPRIIKQLMNQIEKYSKKIFVYKFNLKIRSLETVKATRKVMDQFNFKRILIRFLNKNLKFLNYAFKITFLITLTHLPNQNLDFLYSSISCAKQPHNRLY